MLHKSSNPFCNDPVVGPARSFLPALQLFNLIGHDEEVRFVSFDSPSGNLISGSNDGTVKLWSNETRKPTYSFKLEKGVPLAVDFSPNGTLLALRTDQSQVLVLDSKDLSLKSEINFSLRSSINSRWSPDSSLLMTSTPGGNIHLWNGNNGDLLHDLTIPSGELILADFNHDGKNVLTLNPRELKSYDFKNNETQYKIFPNEDRVFIAGGISNDRSLIALQDSHNELFIYDTANGRKLVTLRISQGPLTHIQFSKSNSTLLISTQQGTGELWQIKLPVRPTQSRL